MAIRLRRAERSTAEEFAADLNLAIADRSLRAAEATGAIGPGAPAEITPRRMAAAKPRRGPAA